MATLRPQLNNSLEVGRDGTVLLGVWVFARHFC